MDSQRFDRLSKALAGGANRRQLLRAAAAGLAVALGGRARGGAQQAKRLLCHATGSATNPWVVIDVAEPAWAEHLAHGDRAFVDCCDDAACAAPQTCGGGGVEGACGCTPRTACQPDECGPVADGCGGELACPPCTVTETFAFTGALQSWTAPAGVTQAAFDARGAQGGGWAVPSGLGGLGGRSAAVLVVAPGQVYTIQVGGQGGFVVGGGGGGFGGGGGGGGHVPDLFDYGLVAVGGGGGGASAVRLGDVPLLIAGGGGGSGGRITSSGTGGGNGGAGGGPSGQPGAGPLGGDGGGGGATAGAGGAGGGDGTAGGAGQGGTGGTGLLGGGGGGGGLFGGGGGSSADADTFVGGGGGGSGFVTPDALSVLVFETGVQTGHGLVTITYATG